MNISLTSSDDFNLTLPSGRDITIPNSPHATAFLYKILYDGERPPTKASGYLGSYPTQHVINKWQQNAARKQAENQRVAAEDLAASYGITLDELDLEL